MDGKITSYFTKRISVPIISTENRDENCDSTDSEPECLQPKAKIKSTKKIVRKKRKSEPGNTPKRKHRKRIRMPDEKRVVPEVPSSTIERQTEKSPLWTEKYRAKTIDALMIDHRNQIETFKSWLATWNEFFNSNRRFKDDEDEEEERFEPGRCLFIYGPSGVGKTTMVYAVAADYGYRVLEYNATSRCLSAKTLQNEFNESFQSYALHHQRNQNGFGKSLILFDDLDAIVYDENSNGNSNGSELWRAMKQILINTRKPIVITSQLDPGLSFGPSADGHHHHFRRIKLDRISKCSMISHLESIFQKENLSLPPTAIHHHHYGSSNPILTSSYGDLRMIVNHFQFWLNDDDESFHQKIPVTEPITETNDSIAVRLEMESWNDIYQTAMDRCSEQNEYHLYHVDNRFSLFGDDKNRALASTVSKSSSTISQQFIDAYVYHNQLTNIDSNIRLEMISFIDYLRELWPDLPLRDFVPIDIEFPILEDNYNGGGEETNRRYPSRATGRRHRKQYLKYFC